MGAFLGEREIDRVWKLVAVKFKHEFREEWKRNATQRNAYLSFSLSAVMALVSWLGLSVCLTR